MAYPIKDTGNRREFETGAVRDISTGKGRCDLMPLDIVERFIYINGAVLKHIEKYKEYGDLDEIYMAIKNFIFYLNFCLNFYEGRVATETIFLELSQHFEEGAKKYGENNWQKGIPISCYIDSGVRHYIRYLRGDKDERHDLAFLWNMVCLMWTHERLPEMIDIEFKVKKGSK